GGITVNAALTCVNCVISNNSATGNGGGVAMSLGNSSNQGFNVFIQNTIISDNQASLSGGGIFASTLSHPDSTNRLKVDKTTLARNQAGIDGGGIFVDGDALSPQTQFVLFTSTISANTAKGNGGGLAIMEGPTSIQDSTIAFNNADVDRVGGGDGGGIFVFTPEENFITNTILAGNDDLSSRVKQRDCSGTIESGGYNLLQSTQGCTFTGSLTGNILNQSPNLLPLNFYLGNEVTQTPPQGLTPTHAYTPTSPGVDDGNPAGCIGTEAQNGVSRHLAATGGGGPGNCDIGAFELVGPDV
ncbi:MAG TPA: choice-of-anchor Q domain-containing protein, partial [Anaerolineales bacterium]|nr:choice-of-anchor Q domain-containing protein [Anaerolineales bacterium]